MGLPTKIYKNSSIFSRFPDQYAELVIEYNFTGGKFGHYNPYEPPGANDEPPEIGVIKAYLVPNIRSAPHILIRPSIASDLFDRYFDDILEDSMNEDISKIAGIITEDPDIFTRNWIMDIELQLTDGVVYDCEREQTNADIQKLAHTLAKIPGQQATLALEFEYQAGTAYLMAQSGNRIRIRPSITKALLRRYADLVVDTKYEDISKIANAITEDPNVYNDSEDAR